jgi:GPI mannosyltransferase 3
LSTDVGARPSSVVSMNERRIAPAGLAVLMALAVVLRLVPTVFVSSMVWGDEIFQATEQAHRLVYGSGLIPWEFQFGVRSWLLPGVIAALMELARIAGDGPDYYLPIIAGAFAILGSASVCCCFLWARRLFGLLGAFTAAAVVAVAPELVYFGARTLSEVVAAHVLVVGLYALEPGYQVTSRRRLFASGVLLGLAFAIRIQLAPALAVVALWTTWREAGERAPSIIAGATVVLVAVGILDTLTLGSPLGSVWRYVLYNLYYGVSSSFGVESWNYYFRGELGVWGGAIASFLLLAVVGARRMPLLFTAAIAILVFHSSLAHKEYRFIYPAILLMTILAGVGLAQLANWAQDWWRERGKEGRMVALACITVASGYWFIIAFQVWTGAALTVLRYRAHDNLSAALFVAHGPVACGIGLYGLGGDDWVAYGGYTYFHRPTPMYWPKDENALVASAPGFDTLIYATAPPEKLSFEPLRCFGEVCVARRRGGCQSIPLMPMPVPKPLIDVSDAKTAISETPPRGRPAENNP